MTVELQAQASVCIVSDTVVFGHTFRAKPLFIFSWRLRLDQFSVHSCRSCVHVIVKLKCVDIALHFSSVLLSVYSHTVCLFPPRPYVVESAESSTCRPLWPQHGFYRIRPQSPKWHIFVAAYFQNTFPFFLKKRTQSQYSSYLSSISKP